MQIVTLGVHCVLAFILGEKITYKQKLDEANKMMAQLEESNLSQMKEADELRSNIRELEASRQEARREIQQLHNQVEKGCFLSPFFGTPFCCSYVI